MVVARCQWVGLFPLRVYATVFLVLLPCPIRTVGTRRRPCTVRNGRWALPLKRLPSTPLLTGLPPRFFRHWRRSAPPPRQGRLPQDPAKPTKAYSPAFCARSFGSAHLSWPSSLAGRAPGGRCGPFLFFAKSPPLLLPRPPRSLKQGRNGPQGRSFASLPGRDIARRAPLGFGLLVLLSLIHI